jgi:hypothetical protein
LALVSMLKVYRAVACCGTTVAATCLPAAQTAGVGAVGACVGARVGTATNPGIGSHSVAPAALSDPLAHAVQGAPGRSLNFPAAQMVQSIAPGATSLPGKHG